MYNYFQIHSAYSGDRSYVFLIKIRDYLGLTDKDIFKIVDKKHPELFLKEEDIFYKANKITEGEYLSSNLDKYPLAEINVRLV